MEFRWDNHENCEEIQEIDDPVKIFGIFKTSKKRKFKKNLLAVDIRPFELWDRFIEKDLYSKLEWLEEKQDSYLSIIFECEDGKRIMGLIEKKDKIFSSILKLKIGDIYEVTGEFNYIKPFVEQGILLFFRIRECKPA